MNNPPRLRTLSIGSRLGLLALIVVILGGLLASAAHLYWHHEVRDERAGLSMDDIAGAYHGVERVAPLLTALEGGHPEELPASDRDVLLAWLGGDRVSEDFDNLDLGDAAPAETIARHCLSCHARNATEGDGIGEEMPLEYWDDVKDLAFSRRINPTSIEILAASTHAHALGLAPLSIVVALLALLTAWPRRLISIGIALMGAALLADVASQWLAREMVGFVWLIVVGGGVYTGATAVLLLAVAIDLLMPPK